MIYLNENKSENQLDIKRIKIKDVSHIGDYLYFIFDNGQKILTNEKVIYDVSEFDYVKNVIIMGNRLCAIVIDNYSPCLIDLNTKEILFKDDKAYSISKEDERTLHVIMKIDCGNNTIYDIERKQYLPMPKDYEYENSLGNGLYVFCQEDNDLSFYERKRCVINCNGEFILNDIEGWIYLEEDYLIIHKDDELKIISLKNDEKEKTIIIIEKNEKILATPQYYNGKVILVFKDKINVYKPSLELIKTIPVEGVSEVKDIERIGDVIKLCIPTIYKGKQNGRHVFVNIETGKKIEHLRIYGYPYWTQLSFVGQDELENNAENLSMDYYFYDKDFNFITKERGTSYSGASDEDEYLFIVSDNGKKKLVNTENGIAKEVDYILVKYNYTAPYGYGVHKDEKTMDFFDKELNVIISNFPFEEYNLDFNNGGFDFFILNNYLCLKTTFLDVYGQYRQRDIIYSKDNEVILDSIDHKCFPIGNFIQIMDEQNSQFLHTLTGRIGDLSIFASVNEYGFIEFNKINELSLDSLPLIIDATEPSSFKKKLTP